MFKYSRLKNLLNAILDAQSPQEVFQKVAKYIGDNTEVTGNIKHKGLGVHYHLVFDRDNQFLTLGLNISPVDKGGIPHPTMGPIFSVHVQVKEDQLALLQSTVTSFLSLLR